MPNSALGWVLLIIVLALIVRNPAGAGHTVASWFDAFVTFVDNL
jgi:hypothetical protein